MGTSVFTWNVKYMALAEGLAAEWQDMPSIGGPDRRRKISASRLVIPNEQVIFTDDTAGKSLASFIEWFRDTLSDGVLSFLYEAHLAALHRVEAESIGTVVASTIADYPLDKKFITEGTPVLTVGGTPTTEFTLVDNNDAPKLRTTASVPGGAGSVSYRFRHQMRFTNPNMIAQFLSRATDLSTPGVQTIPISMREVRPRGHLV